MTYFISTFRPTGLAVIALSTLAACGGGGGAAAPTAFATFNDATSQQTSALAAASLDTRARSTVGLTGSLNRAANTASLGSQSGTINAGRSAVALTGGGLMTLDASGQIYSARYIATPTTGNRTQGVLGAVTSAADLPTGTATLNGATTLTLQDGTTVYDLSGTAKIDAHFGTNLVTTTLSALDGTQSNGITATVNVTDVATVTITGSAISGATFRGGAVNVASTTVSAVSSAATTSVNGAFFGPAGEEAGGVFVVDDTGTGNIRIFGDFIGR